MKYSSQAPPDVFRPTQQNRVPRAFNGPPRSSVFGHSSGEASCLSLSQSLSPGWLENDGEVEQTHPLEHVPDAYLCLDWNSAESLVALFDRSFCHDLRFASRYLFFPPHVVWPPSPSWHSRTASACVQRVVVNRAACAAGWFEVSSLDSIACTLL